MHWISVWFYEMGDILLRLAELYAEFRWGPTPASFDVLCKSESVRNVWKLLIRRKNLIRSLFFISDLSPPPHEWVPLKTQSLGWCWSYSHHIKGMFAALNYIPSRAAGTALFRLHPQKQLTICTVLAYQGFKSREGIISLKNSCWMIKDIGILESQNNLWKNSLIGGTRRLSIHFVFFF